MVKRTKKQFQKIVNARLLVALNIIIIIIRANGEKKLTLR